MGRGHLLALALAPALWACPEEDTGRCCQVLKADAATPPIANRPDAGIPRDQIRVNLLYDCEQLTCVAYQGSEAFCTRKCDEESPCPDGFDCVQILTADPGPDAQIRPTDRFCARKRCETAADCPDDFRCDLVHPGAGTPDDPVIRHCVKPDHLCAAN